MCATGLCETSRDKEHSCCLPPRRLCRLALCAYVCRWQQVKTRRARQWPLRRRIPITPAAAWHSMTHQQWDEQVMKPSDHFFFFSNECQSVKKVMHLRWKLSCDVARLLRRHQFSNLCGVWSTRFARVKTLDCLFCSSFSSTWQEKTFASCLWKGKKKLLKS